MSLLDFDVEIIRSESNPERYFLKVIEDGSCIEAYVLHWRHLEKLNGQIVKLRAEDSVRYASEEAAEGEEERRTMGSGR